MSAFGGLILTNRGKILQSKAQSGVELKYTRMAVGDGYLGTSSIINLNALIHEVKSLNLTKLKTLGDGKAVIGAVLSNQDLTEGFYFREIGLFATDPDVGEVLYCYGNAGDLAEYIPAGGIDVIEKNIDVQTIIGNATNVTAVIDSSLVWETVEGSQEKADKAEANANAYTDEKFSQITYPVTSVNGKTGDITLTADDVGAETPEGAQLKADAAETNAKNASIPKTDKGTPGGVPVLDTNGKIESQYLPDIAITNTFVVNSEEAMLALSAETGDVCVRTDLSKSFILMQEPASDLENWQVLLYPPDAVLSVNGKTGVVNLSASDVGAYTKDEIDAMTVVKTVNSKSGIVTLSASDVGAETPSGAQEKANQAENNAKTYSDQKLNAHQADYVKHPGFGVTTNSANAYAVTLNPAPTSYVDGMAISVKINADSTGPATLNVNGLGAKPLKKANGNDAMNLKANGVYTFRYNASTGNFILQGEGSDFSDTDKSNLINSINAIYDM